MNRFRTLSVAFAAAFAGAAAAQDFPTRPLTLVVPFPPGGATDVLARTLAGPLERQLGRSVVVDNRPGADGRIGARHVAASAADGHTVIIQSGSTVSWPLFFKDPGVDVFKDLAPAGMIVDGSLVLVASPRTPFETVPGMIEYAKKNPGKVTWSLPSRNGEPALYLHLLRAKAGLDMLEVPYKGSGPQTAAVIAGEVDIGQFAPGRALQMAQSGQGKLLAVSGERRDPLLPQVPTMKEFGIDGIVNYNFGLLARAGTASAQIGRWNAVMIAALKDPVVASANAKFGFSPIGNSPAQHAAELSKSFENWKIAAKVAKIQPE